MKKIFLFLLLVLVFKAEAQTSVLKVVDGLLLKGNYQEALALLSKEKQSLEVCDKTAAIYQSIGDYNKAITYYKQALAIETNEAIKVKLAKVYNSAGLPSKAISIYEEIIVKDTSNLLVTNTLGKLYLARNQSKKAEKLYQFLKKKDSLNPNYPYQLAKSYSKQNKPFKMGQSYLDAYNIDTLHLKSIYGIAKFFKKLRVKDSTMLFIDKGLRINANSLNFIQLKANELYYTKDFKNAIKSIKKLDSLNFKSVNTYEMLGMSYYNLKDYKNAEAAFKKALKIDRMNSKVLYRLASVYYDQKNNKLSRLNLLQSIMYGRGDLDKQYFLSGIIAKEENDLKMALKYFKDAVSYNSKNYKALYQLAVTSDAYYKDKKIALKHYQRFNTRHANRDKEMIAFVEQRIKEIKKEFFIKGEIVD